MFLFKRYFGKEVQSHSVPQYLYLIRCIGRYIRRNWTHQLRPDRFYFQMDNYGGGGGIITEHLAFYKGLLAGELVMLLAGLLLDLEEIILLAVGGYKWELHG